MTVEPQGDGLYLFRCFCGVLEGGMTREKALERQDAHWLDKHPYAKDGAPWGVV